jgi:hypothetical protein
MLCMLAVAEPSRRRQSERFRHRCILLNVVSLRKTGFDKSLTVRSIVSSFIADASIM